MKKMDALMDFQLAMNWRGSWFQLLFVRSVDSMTDLHLLSFLIDSLLGKVIELLMDFQWVNISMDLWLVLLILVMM